MSTEKKENEWVTCSCCGNGIKNNQKENASFNEVPYPQDEGFGMCIDCGGDKQSRSFKKKLGWGLRCFYEARFDIVRKNISEEKQKKWDSCNYRKKCLMIALMVEKEIMI